MKRELLLAWCASSMTLLGWMFAGACGLTTTLSIGVALGVGVVCGIGMRAAIAVWVDLFRTDR